MFYERYLSLCEKHGKRPYEVAREMGCSNSNVAQWKKGSVPRMPMVEKIAEYFGVSAGYLITGEEQQKKPTDQRVSELSDDEVTRQLHDMILSATDEERQDIMKYIEFIKSKRK